MDADRRGSRRVEAPSAGFALDWRTLDALRARGIAFATLTDAAGISSTGDVALDRRLPFDEPYRIPEATARAIAQARARGGRIVAVGTTVVRALEAAAARDGVVHAGDGVATQRIGPGTRLAVVDAILSGAHEPGSSHHELLGAFAAPRTLRAADRELEARGYRTHEFGDSVLVFSSQSSQSIGRISRNSSHARRAHPVSGSVSLRTSPAGVRSIHSMHASPSRGRTS